PPCVDVQIDSSCPPCELPYADSTCLGPDILKGRFDQRKKGQFFRNAGLLQSVAKSFNVTARANDAIAESFFDASLCVDVAEKVRQKSIRQLQSLGSDGFGDLP